MLVRWRMATRRQKPGKHSCLVHQVEAMSPFGGGKCRGGQRWDRTRRQKEGGKDFAATKNYVLLRELNMGNAEHIELKEEQQSDADDKSLAIEWEYGEGGGAVGNV